MNKTQLTDLITLGEGFTTEFKKSRTSSLGREICASANATGGAFLIGVSDKGQVVGVTGHNRLKSEVQTTARSAELDIEVSESWVTTTFSRPGRTVEVGPQPESQPELQRQSYSQSQGQSQGQS